MLCTAAIASAQEPAPAAPPAEDTRTQFPAFMRDSYVTLRGGWIGYLFTARQLEPASRRNRSRKPRPAVRLDFFGHQSTKNFGCR